jgi:uncharacterized membrane protein YczE
MFGLFLYAVGIVTQIKANVGYAPWDVFHVGLGDKIGLPMGLTSIIVGFAIVAVVTISGEKLGIATILNIVLIGVFVDIINFSGVIPVAANFAVGMVMLVAGLFVIALASFFYIRAAFGVGPRDNLMVALARKTKLPVGLCRGTVELLAALFGWLMGGMAGIGTVVSFIGIGACIQIVFGWLKFDVKAVRHEPLNVTLAKLARLIKREKSQ